MPLNSPVSSLVSSPVNSPVYSLTNTLRRLSFIIHSKLHNIKPVYTKIESADQCLILTIDLLESHAYISDLGLPDIEVRQCWERLDAAIQTCQNECFTDDHLKGLLNAVVAFGRGRIAWTAQIRMDGNGTLYAMQT